MAESHGKFINYYKAYWNPQLYPAVERWQCLYTHLLCPSCSSYSYCFKTVLFSEAHLWWYHPVTCYQCLGCVFRRQGCCASGCYILPRESRDQREVDISMWITAEPNKTPSQGAWCRRPVVMEGHQGDAYRIHTFPMESVNARCPVWWEPRVLMSSQQGLLPVSALRITMRQSDEHPLEGGVQSHG